MCKIAILTSHNPKRVRETVLSTWAAMSTTERDGFGACWLTPTGRLASVRSSTPTEQSPMPDFVESFWDGAFGTSNGGPLIIHGRTATCDVELGNTHPIIIGNRALVHNGIVSSTRYHNVETTCDSELLLHAWADNEIGSVENHVTGYYAFGVITASRRGWTLDIVRDSRAKLVAGRNPDDKGYTFATTDAVLAATGAKRCGTVRNDVWIRYKGNRHVHTKGFTPKVATFTRREEALVERSLGPSAAPKSTYASTNWRARPYTQEEMF
jgi:hypothetical protein